MVLVLVAAAVAAYALTRGETQEVPANGATISIGAGAGPGTMIDLRTGDVTPLPTSFATSGTYYALSPDQTTVAYSTCCNPPEPLYMANVDGTQVRQISATGEDVFGAQWSPDGSMLVYQQRDGSTQLLGNLYVQDVATGQRTRLTNFDQTQPWDWWFTFPSFAPDGQSILFQLPRGDPANNQCGTSGPCRSPAGSRPSFNATPRGAGTRRTARGSRISHRWIHRT